MFSAERYQVLFMENPGPEGILHEGVNKYRVKRIKAGDTLEIEAFPIWIQCSRQRRPGDRARSTGKL